MDWCFQTVCTFVGAGMSGCSEELSPAGCREAIGHRLRLPTKSGHQLMRKRKSAYVMLAFLTADSTPFQCTYRADGSLPSSSASMQS
jgi:hypothetical protein